MPAQTAADDYGPRVCNFARAQSDTAQRGLRTILAILDADVTPHAEVAAYPSCAREDAELLRERVLEMIENFEEARRG